LVALKEAEAAGMDAAASAGALGFVALAFVAALLAAGGLATGDGFFAGALWAAAPAGIAATGSGVAFFGRGRRAPGRLTLPSADDAVGFSR